MSSSQESTVERRLEHHVAHSSSLTGSDFEFDLGVSDVADPPVSPKLVSSETSIPSTFEYSDFWTDVQVYKRQVPVLAPIPRRSSPSLSVRQLVATEMTDDASSCASYPQSPRSQRPDDHIGRRGAGHIIGDAVEIKNSRARNEQKSKSSPDMRIFQHPSRARRVHHADEDHYLSSRRSDSHLSMLDSSSGDEESTSVRHERAGKIQHRKRWTLKDLMRTSRRSSSDQSKAQITENLELRQSKSTPERALPRSPKMSPRPMSPHEAHYKNQRAQWDEMKKKTTLPFKQGLLGCLGGPVFSGLQEYRPVM